MVRKTFGWTGVEVPAIGQGTWMIEGSPAAEQRALEALRAGLDLGLTHIDTAEMYGSGRVEEIVADAIDGRRNEVFLVSKVLPSNASYWGTLRACERSLKRLRTDWLDLYLLHWAGSFPIEQTMRAMEELAASGAVRFIGVSNFDVEELKDAQSTLRKERLACDQVLYHLGDRGIERKLIPYCVSQGIAVAGYSPFGHGSFPARGSPGWRILEEAGDAHGRTPRQTALNFLAREDGVFTIAKASSVGHVRENAGGMGWSLGGSDIGRIDKAFPAPIRDQPLGMI